MKYLNGNVMSELERLLQNVFAIAKASDKSPARLAREWLGEIRSATYNDYKRKKEIICERCPLKKELENEIESEK